MVANAGQMATASPLHMVSRIHLIPASKAATYKKPIHRMAVAVLKKLGLGSGR